MPVDSEDLAILLEEYRQSAEAWRHSQLNAERRMTVYLGVVASLVAATAFVITAEETTFSDSHKRQIIGTAWALCALFGWTIVQRLTYARLSAVRNIKRANNARDSLRGLLDAQHRSALHTFSRPPRPEDALHSSLMAPVVLVNSSAVSGIVYFSIGQSTGSARPVIAVAVGLAVLAASIGWVYRTLTRVKDY